MSSESLQGEGRIVLRFEEVEVDRIPHICSFQGSVGFFIFQFCVGVASEMVGKIARNDGPCFFGFL